MGWSGGGDAIFKSKDQGSMSQGLFKSKMLTFRGYGVSELLDR